MKTIKFYLCLAVVAGVLFAILFNIHKTMYRKEHLRQALKLTDTIQTYIQKNYVSTDLLVDQISGLPIPPDYRVSILAEDGTILCDSKRTDTALSSFIYNQEVLEAKKGFTASSISDIQGKTILSTASAPFRLGKKVIIIHLEIPLNQWKTLNHIQMVGWLIYALFILACLLPTMLSNIKPEPGIPVKDSSDLTDNFKTEHLANERISLFSTLFTGLPEGMVLFDLSGRIQMINPQAKQMIGVGNDVFFKDIWDTSLFTSTFNMLVQEVKQTIESKTSTKFNMETESGKIFEISVSTIKNKYQPFEICGVLALLRDVTEFKHMEQQQNEFVSNVSHELRTPLTLISGFVETLQEWESIPSEDRSEALKIISIETERLKRLISQLLKLSRIDNRVNTTTGIKFNAIPVIAASLPSLHLMAEKKNQQFISNLPDCEAYILGHEGWLTQIIYNLCENAFKYTPDNGNIELTVNVTDSDLIISVKDNGIGIPEKEQKFIFERFYRVDKARNSKIPGSGLGLALTRDIVRVLSGQISLVSQPGKGSQFIVTLPLIIENTPD